MKHRSLLTLFLSVAFFYSYCQITGPSPIMVGSTSTYFFDNGIAQNEVFWEVSGGSIVTEDNTGTQYTAIVYWTSISANNFVKLWKVAFVHGGEPINQLVAVKTVDVTTRPPSTPNTSVTSSAQCGHTLVSRTSNPTLSYDWFWQTTATGTNESNSGPNIIVLAGQNLYLRSRTSTSPYSWSTTSQSFGTFTPKVVPSIPTVTSVVSRCGPGSILLTGAVGANGTTLRWFSDDDETLLATAPGYSPTVTSTKYFFVASYNETTGCESSHTLVQVIINPIPTAAVSYTTQTICTDQTMNPVTITNPNNVEGTMFTWTVNSPNITGASPENSSLISQTLSHTTSSNQTATYSVTPTANGCSGTAVNTTVTIKPKPTTANAGADQSTTTTCGLTGVTLAGNTPTIGTGVWSIVSGAGGSFGNTTSATSTFTGTAGTTYTLRWTISNSPCPSSSDDVIIKFNRTPTIANAGVDLTATMTCGLTGVTLAGNTPTTGTGVWSIVSGAGGSFGNTTSATSTFTGTAGTTYTLRWTISNSPCTSSSDDVIIKFNRTPTIANAGVDQTGALSCGLTSVTLAGNTPTTGTGAWSVVSGAGGSFGNTTSAASTFTGTAGTMYTLRWTINNSPCISSSDDVIIKFNTTPATANAGIDQTTTMTCGLTGVTLAGNTPTIGTGVWSVVSGAGGSFGNTTNAASTFTGTAGTMYTLRWTINNSPCISSSDDVIIKFNTTPTTANAGIDQTTTMTCGLTGVTLAGNTPTIGTGVWSVVSGAGGSFGNIASAASTFTGTAGTMYTLRWTINNSPCTSSSDDVVIKFNRNPIAANAGIDQTGTTTCGLTTLTLSGNMPSVGSGTWSVVSGAGGSFENPTSATTTFSGKSGTAYTLRWTISSDLCGSSADEIAIKFNQDLALCVNQNFVISNTILVEGITELEGIHALPVEHRVQAIQYFDGLGRLLQSVITQGSPSKLDIIQPVAYDAFGREFKKYLPYTSGNDGWYKPDVLVEQSTFYSDNTSGKIPNDPSPFALTIFEPSPLNRLIKQGAPGTDWQPDADHNYASTDHTVKFSYEFNEANEVLKWTFEYPTEEYTSSALNAFGKVNAGTAAVAVYYAANQIYRNKTKDEQGNQVIEYVDKEGRTVLKRVQTVTGNPTTVGANKDSNWASTYYIYDDFGNLVVVITPEASNRLATQYFQTGSTDASKNAFLKRWAFRYRYDARKRMTMKQVPGAEPVFMVYDSRDRLVMTQDGNQRSAKRWTFTKYDVLNRPVLTGIHTADSVLLLNKMQRRVNVYNAAVPGNGGEWFESFSASNTIHGYDNKSYPLEADSSNYLSVNYYDDYDARSTWGGSYEYFNEGLSQTVQGMAYSQPALANVNVKGLLTATKVKVLNGGVTGGQTWLKTINYYDDKYRIVQNITDNYKGGVDRANNLYDFVGKVLQQKTTHETADILWTDLMNTNGDGNKLTSASTFTQAWGNSGAASVQKAMAGQDAWMEFTVSQTWGNTMVGLSDQNVDANYTSIDYAFYVTGGLALRIYENGTSKYAIPGGYKLGDLLGISRVGSVIKYYRNEVLVYTSSIPSSSTLLVDVAFYNTNLSVTNVRTSFSSTSSTIHRHFDYDHAGRLVSTWHSINGENPVLLVHNEYNELGQLIDKDLHSTIADASDAEQSVDYRYNIRGWLTSINNAQLTSDDSNDDTDDYFGMQLAYDTDLGTGNVGDLQYNGNISATKWSNLYGQSNIKENAYNYTYDAMNRLKTADFRQQVAGTWGLGQYRAANGSMQSVNAFSEAITDGLASGYDLNGNIKVLKRTGQDGQLIDDLIYNYGVATSSQSNKLLWVSDASNDLNGFVEVNSSIDDYTYDNNGNLLYDRNKSSEEMVKNGSFDAGSADWTVDVPSRVNFANGRAEIAAGAGVLTLSQSVVIKNSTQHIVNLAIVRTSSTGTINVKVGSSSANHSLSASTSVSVVAGATDDVKFIVSTDFAGYIEEVSLHATTAITYNFLNLPETVTQGEKGTIRYIYTATGQKLAQVVREGTTTKITDYLGEYIYQNDTLQFINHEEGRIIPPLSSGEGAGGEAEYQYHLKDHLGNVRLTFTTKQEVEEAIASLETENENKERADFLKYDDIRKVNSPLFDHTTTGTTQYAIRLTGTPAETYGLARSIAVMPGDKIKAEVFAKYLDTNSANWTAALTDLIAAIASGGTAPGTVVDGGTYGSSASTNIPFASPIGKSTEPSDIPKAYLNWLVFDKNFVPLASKSGFRRISSAGMENGLLTPEGVPHEKLESPLIEINEPGYVYIYLSNEEPGKEVYFDDFKVTHSKSPVIQSDDYYPFGLTFNSYSRENSTPNQYKYNGMEEQDELGLNWLDYGARMYMPDIGRWGAIDPLSDKGRRMSPYSYVYNNPLIFVDPDGMFGEYYTEAGKYLGTDGIDDKKVYTADKATTTISKADDGKEMTTTTFDNAEQIGVESDFVDMGGKAISNEGVKKGLVGLAIYLRNEEGVEGAKVTVTGGDRSKEKNANIGGAKGSEHTKGNAADIQVSGMTNKELATATTNSGLFNSVIYYPDRGDRSNFGTHQEPDEARNFASGGCEGNPNYQKTVTNSQQLGPHVHVDNGAKKFNGYYIGHDGKTNRYKSN